MKRPTTSMLPFVLSQGWEYLEYKVVTLQLSLSVHLHLLRSFTIEHISSFISSPITYYLPSPVKSFSSGDVPLLYTRLSTP